MTPLNFDVTHLLTHLTITSEQDPLYSCVVARDKHGLMPQAKIRAPILFTSKCLSGQAFSHVSPASGYDQGTRFRSKWLTHGLRSQTTTVWTLARPLVSWVTRGKSFNLPVAQVLHLCNGADNAALIPL